MHKSSSEKLLPLLALLFTTSVSIALFPINRHDFSGKTVRMVTRNRDTVAICVQILAAIFGMLQTWVICSLTNKANRLRLRQSTTLHEMSMWMAISIPRVDFSLPWSMTLLCISVLVITNLFAAVWAGALTPLTDQTRGVSAAITLPAYSNVTKGWRYENANINQRCRREKRISNCAVLDSTGLMIQSLRTATSVDGPSIHNRIDNAKWSYAGRSFGVGGSQGLVDVTALSYEYAEVGYQAEASCLYNRTSAFGLRGAYTLPNNDARLLYTRGQLADPTARQEPDYYLLMDNVATSPFAWTAGLGVSQIGHLSMAGDVWYKPFNQTQCTITFKPKVFTVRVNSTSSRVTVQPENDVDEFNPSNQIRQFVMDSLSLVSRITSNSGHSALGDALGDEQATLKQIHGWDDSTAILRAAEAGIGAMIDDILLSIGTFQLQIEKDTQRGQVFEVVQIMRIGALRFVIAINAVSLIIVLAVIVEALRTRWWRGLPDFNPLETVNLVGALLNDDVRQEALGRRTVNLRDEKLVVAGMLAAVANQSERMLDKDLQQTYLLEHR